MAKTDNLTDFLTDIAAVIRAKKGTSDLINPQDFSAEIASIQSGDSPFSWDWTQIGYTPENTILQQQFEDDIAYSKSLAEEYTPSKTSSHFKENERLKFAPMVDTSNVTDMSGMFERCSALISIPQLDTSNVISMNSMFSRCTALTTIPQLDTSNVTDMSFMFHICTALITIPLLDTSNVTYMSTMFYDCSSLIAIPQLDTSNVISMNSMFSRCTALTTIPQLNTSNVTGMSGMFERCSALISIPQLDTSNVISMNSMFNECQNLRKITRLDLSNVTNTYDMFTNCPHLNYILLTNIGRNENATYFNFDGATAWGYGEDYEVNKQSLIDSIVNNTFDRASAGYSIATIYLSYYVESLFTEEQLEQVRNKGYNISFVAPPSTE